MTTTKLPPLPAASVSLNDLHDAITSGTTPAQAVADIKTDLGKAKAEKVAAAQKARDEAAKAAEPTPEAEPKATKTTASKAATAEPATTDAAATGAAA